MMENLKKALIAQAHREGFAKVGICAPDAAPEMAGRLQEFLAQGHHGQMGWMSDRTHWRGNPAALWPAAKSIIMLAELYTPPQNPLADPPAPDKGAVSVYAQGKDYHDPVKKRLKRLGGWLCHKDRRLDDVAIKVFVDTAPVMEKPLAQAAGLGWQGKHTNLLARDLGNWFFLGAIFTNLDLPKDPPHQNHCGQCRACLDICPTNAFVAPYRLDARRCISYLTIEHHGSIDPDLRPLMKNYIYGCDDCLAVCPWNKFARAAHETGYEHRIHAPPLADLVHLNDADFRTFFTKSPVKRIGRNRFVRNVLYAIGNSKDMSLIPHAQALLQDPDPVIQDAAQWALNALKTAGR